MFGCALYVDSDSEQRKLEKRIRKNTYVSVCVRGNRTEEEGNESSAPSDAPEPTNEEECNSGKLRNANATIDQHGEQGSSFSDFKTWLTNQ
ncbi:hypothetical protein T07_14737 [Trichinella nelsoni]|uniref:Uncharacterized protein n=1 Tax=Trichinella nelsoni TaxID=6336 RepID=A0A0V0RUB8_9BILA|nr:hypothetical protein T07_14737 [Trichinella nelsoni]